MKIDNKERGKKMNCKKCGMPLTAEDLFCKNCGASVNQLNAQPNQNLNPMNDVGTNNINNVPNQTQNLNHMNNAGTNNINNVPNQIQNLNPMNNAGTNNINNVPNQTQNLNPMNNAGTNNINNVPNQTQNLNPMNNAGTNNINNVPNQTQNLNPMNNAGTNNTNNIPNQTQNYSNQNSMTIKNGSVQMNTPNQNMSYPFKQANSTSKSNMPKVVIGVVAIIAIVVLAIIIVPKFLNNGNSENASSITSKSTYKVSYGGFTFKIPDNLMYEISNDELIIGDEDGTWMVELMIVDGSFNQIKNNKSIKIIWW